MLVQLLHLIPERFLILCQHAQEWIFEIQVKWRKHSVALLASVSNLKEDQSVVALVVQQTLEAVLVVHCQEGNEINNNRKENRLTFEKVFFFYPHQSLLQEFAVNPQLLRPHL